MMSNLLIYFSGGRGEPGRSQKGERGLTGGPGRSSWQYYVKISNFLFRLYRKKT